MLFLRALLLAALVTLHVIGAAVLARRLFPRESLWLAFLLPPLALVVLLNFIEHFVALPRLEWLLLPIDAAIIWAVCTTPRESTRELWLPGAIFTVAFGFVLAVKSLHPMILNTSEAVADLNRMEDFCFGQLLPPIDGFLPPNKHQWYYTFQHYGASVLRRLFALDLGTGYNFSFALVNAWVGLICAGVAWHLSRGRAWVAWVTFFLIEAAFTGSSPLIELLSPKGAVNPWISSNLTIDWNDPLRNPFSPLLQGEPYHETLKLFPPGTWIWLDEFHPTFGGQFLTLLAVLATMIVFLPQRSNAGWICLLTLPLVTLISATWFLPVVAMLCVGALVVAWWAGRRPESLGLVLAASVVIALMLLPTVASFMSWRPHQEVGWTRPEWHTPLRVFLIQWWPVYLPWLALAATWRRLPLEARWLHAAVAILFIGVEMINVGSWRMDTIEKMWGAIYAVGFVTFIPLVLSRGGIAFRSLGAILVVAGAISLFSWCKVFTGWVDWKNDFLHFKGDSYLVKDPQKARMLEVLRTLQGATVLAGKAAWNYNEPPGMVVLSENRCFVAWTFSEAICGHQAVAEARAKLNNDFLAGLLADPLGFLESNNISAALIYPGDQISDAVVQRLKTQLAPVYRYVDCRGDGPENAGVFIRSAAAPVVH